VYVEGLYRSPQVAVLGVQRGYGISAACVLIVEGPGHGSYPPASGPGQPRAGGTPYFR
jgi:hypothetical protein